MPILLLVVVGVAAVAAAPADFYESRYDHLDIENILNNRRMVNYYAACLLSKGPCPPQGLEFKRILPEALQTNCAKCTEKQRTVAYRTIKRLKKEYPKIWDQLQVIWDPDNVYVPKFEATFDSSSNKKPIAPVQSPFIANRFGDDEDQVADNVVSSPPLRPPSTTRTTTTTSTTTTTKPTTNKKPTSSIFLLTRPPQTPPYTSVGANLQATVSFVAALKNIVIQLYQLKLDTINRILSGR